MRNTAIAATLLAAVTLGAAGAGNAGPIGPPAGPITITQTQPAGVVDVTYRRHVLPRHVIVRSLYKRGYRKVHRVYFHRGYWRARAVGRRGVVALTIDPRTARIVHRRLVRPFHRYRPYHRGGLSFSFGLH
ncbi:MULTISPECIES: hypothetical protein [unclassified Roseitalea]|uniref:hypothetical protein n=1 Tax=unclassified Roseitalea TaxID=2639107 RepID=UPI00273F432C|nr:MULTISPECIES: hypothetical protein [unclassified Roseitalea]